MKPHTWTTEEIDGGPMGMADFWKCLVCGASGGVVWPHKAKPRRAFLANGSGLTLSDDCVVAKLQVKAFEVGYAYALTK